MIDTLPDSATSASEQAATAGLPDDASDTEVAGDPKYWRLLAKNHRDSLKLALLGHSERERFITERMTVAEQKVTSDKPDEGVAIFQLFREVFRADKDVEAWFEYASRRTKGEPAKMPGTK